MAITNVDIGTEHKRPAPRSSDTKAAIEYLVASGATAITITEHDGVCSFHVGHKFDLRAVSVQWVLQAQAREIVKLARRRQISGRC